MEPEGRPRYPAYVRKIPRTWWLRSGPFRRFAARELTSLFAAAFSVILLLFLFALSRGPRAYEGFLRWLKLPAVVALFAVILVALLYHVGTWFRLTTHIVVIRLRGVVVPRAAIGAALVVALFTASAFVLYFHVWF